MTREFNKQQRYGSHSSYRNPNSSSHFHEDERSPRPARPRLNRETVDRAWENGAANRHPDYRPRNNQGQPPRNSWQKRPYGNNTQGSNRHSYGNGNDQRSRHDYRDRYNQDSQRSDSYGKNQQHHTQGYRSNEGRYNNNRPNYQQPAQNRYAQSPYHDQKRGRYEQNRFQGHAYDEQGNNFERPGYPPRSRQQHEQYNDRPNYQQRKPYAQPGTQKRYQNRPGYQNQQQDPYTARFEGDYERFAHERESGNARPYRQGQPFQQKPSSQRFRDDRPAPERPVTRLSDGRVLKGPRPVQRRNARFWTEVSHDASQILDQQQTFDETAAPTVETTAPPEQSLPISTHLDMEEPDAKPQQRKSSNRSQGDTQSKKPTRRVASAARRKKAIGTGKPATTRPSQRGFKWPASDA